LLAAPVPDDKLQNGLFFALNQSGVQGRPKSGRINSRDTLDEVREPQEKLTANCQQTAAAKPWPPSDLIGAAKKSKLQAVS
jgi:hypothetical protein